MGPHIPFTNFPVLRLKIYQKKNDQRKILQFNDKRKILKSLTKLFSNFYVAFRLLSLTFLTFSSKHKMENVCGKFTFRRNSGDKVLVLFKVFRVWNMFIVVCLTCQSISILTFWRILWSHAVSNICFWLATFSLTYTLFWLTWANALPRIPSLPIESMDLSEAIFSLFRQIPLNAANHLHKTYIFFLAFEFAIIFIG